MDATMMDVAREIQQFRNEDNVKKDNKISGAQEGSITGTIETQTSKIPSGAFLGAAFGSIAISALFKANGNEKAALFVGQWVAPFLLLGVYNKLVKQLGSDADARVHGSRATQAAAD